MPKSLNDTIPKGQGGKAKGYVARIQAVLDELKDEMPNHRPIHEIEKILADMVEDEDNSDCDKT